MYRYDSGRSGYSPDRGPADEDGLLWFLPVDGGVKCTPAYWDGMLFFGTGQGELLCAAAADGRVFWSTRFGGEFRSTPAISGDVLVVGVHDGALSAGRGYLAGIDVDSGKELWGVHNYGVTMAPLIVDGVAYVGSSEGVFFGVEVESGIQRWVGRHEASNGAPSLAAADGVLVVVTSSGLVRGIALPDGQELWSFFSNYDNATTPAIASGYVVLTNIVGQLICLSLKSGQPLWTIRTNTNMSSPAVHRGRVFINRGPNGHIAAYSLQSGQLLWESEIVGDALSSPTVTSNYLYAKGSGLLAALSADTGETVWSVPFSELLATSPMVARRGLYIGSHWHGSGGLHAFGSHEPFNYDKAPI